MIKNFIFDMGEVLLHFNVRDFADRYDISEEDKDVVLDALFANGLWTLADWGYIDEAEAARRANEKLPERLHSVTEGIALGWHSELDPVEGMADFVRRVKESGYGVYLLSNAGSLHSEYWARVPGSEYFDGKVISAYEKLLKPQPEIYKLLCDRYALKPEECLFIDDREVNLAGALVAGLHPMIFKGAEDLERRLKALGMQMGTVPNLQNGNI